MEPASPSQSWKVDLNATVRLDMRENIVKLILMTVHQIHAKEKEVSAMTWVWVWSHTVSLWKFSFSVNNYECKCQSGLRGKSCEENIYDCEPNPCIHGICMDKIGGYKCDCDKGYTGTNCTQVHSLIYKTFEMILIFIFRMKMTARQIVVSMEENVKI